MRTVQTNIASPIIDSTMYATALGRLYRPCFHLLRRESTNLSLRGSRVCLRIHRSLAPLSFQHQDSRLSNYLPPPDKRNIETNCKERIRKALRTDRKSVV